MSLEGRAAVVTGGSGGIGRAASVALARAGARLLLVGRNEASLSETAQALQDAGAEAKVAAIVAFLASDAASIVNGVAWPVDGGALATMANPG